MQNEAKIFFQREKKIFPTREFKNSLFTTLTMKGRNNTKNEFKIAPQKPAIMKTTKRSVNLLTIIKALFRSGIIRVSLQSKQFNSQFNMTLYCQLATIYLQKRIKSIFFD